MPDDLDTPALRRFARDLRRIRESRSVSRAAIQEETQVHASHLKSFEEGVLHEEERMNGVYLKAFVRAYAEAIGLSAETVVDHLESALSGSYDDQLAVAFLQAPPAEDGSDDPEAGAAEPSIAGGRDAADPSPGSADEPDDGSRSPDESPQGAATDPPPASPEDQSPAAQPQTDSSPGGAASASDSERSSPDPQEDKHFSDLAEEDEATAGPTRSPERGASPPRATSQTDSFSTDAWGFLSAHRDNVLTTIGIALLLVLVGGLGFYLMGDDTPSESPSGGETLEASPAAEAGPSATEATGDTTASASPPRRPPADITLGDTLHVTVRATADVRELRVQQDDNLRRPYWIESGEARVFPFTERVTLQNQLDSLELLLEGYRYPITSTDEQGRVIIRRDTAEQFADTLRGAPVSVSASPDTIRGRDSFPEPDTTSAAPSGPGT